MDSREVDPEFADPASASRPRVTVRRMMVTIAIVGLVLGLAKFLFIDNRPLDIPAWALSALAGHSTIYVEGYDESKFRSIRVGMTIREVADLMVEPQDIEKFRDNPVGTAPPGQGILNEIWKYTYPGKMNGNYWRRDVWFRDGKVYLKNSNYWWQ